MNIDLTQRLIKLKQENKTFRIGVIGAGKFATMFLTPILLKTKKLIKII